MLRQVSALFLSVIHFAKAARRADSFSPVTALNGT
jgi:hypothetical protein